MLCRGGLRSLLVCIILAASATTLHAQAMVMATTFTAALPTMVVTSRGTIIAATLVTTALHKGVTASTPLVSTSTTMIAYRGETEVQVASVEGFSIGDQIRVGDADAKNVSGVHPLIIFVNSPLSKAYLAGTPVVMVKPLNPLTKTTVTASGGDTELALASTEGFSIGDRIRIGDAETKTVIAINPFTLDSPLSKTYVVGTLVKWIGRATTAAPSESNPDSKPDSKDCYLTTPVEICTDQDLLAWAVVVGGSFVCLLILCFACCWCCKRDRDAMKAEDAPEEEETGDEEIEVCSCGVAFRPGAKFCHKCGMARKEANPQEASEPVSEAAALVVIEEKGPPEEAANADVVLEDQEDNCSPDEGNPGIMMGTAVTELTSYDIPGNFLGTGATEVTGRRRALL